PSKIDRAIHHTSIKQQENNNKKAKQTETITRLTKEKRMYEYESRELHQFSTGYLTIKATLTGVCEMTA
ncbi:hypothetical protein OCL90_14415, partial [Enterococcus faecalis]|nr:hypothetical protein [Enterococcus faecalis]